MAAAIALLTAAGMLPNATERAKSSSQRATERPTTSGNATERATSSSQLDPAASLWPRTGIPKSRGRPPLKRSSWPPLQSQQQASASEDGFLIGDADLEKIVALLLWMSQDPSEDP